MLNIETMAIAIVLVVDIIVRIKTRVPKNRSECLLIPINATVVACLSCGNFGSKCTGFICIAENFSNYDKANRQN